jgi:hypothetical protein
MLFLNADVFNNVAQNTDVFNNDLKLYIIIAWS